MLWKFIWNITKFIIVFATFTCLFYVGLTYFHAEYEYEKLYEEPDGRAEKVFHTFDDVINRMHVFLRLGE